MGTGRGRRTAKKRPVYVNGVFCDSMTAGAVSAGKILKRKVAVWEIQKILKGQKNLAGVTVSEKPPPQSREPPAPEKRHLSPLLRYPLGESPLDMGAPEKWR